MSKLMSGCEDFLTATPKPKFIDESYITEQPCKPPCWQGLNLNEATTEQIYKKLKELPFVEQTSVKTVENVTLFDFTNATDIFYRCIGSGEDICGSLLLVDGVLKISMHKVLYPLTLKEVIDELGEPLQVHFAPYSPHGDGCKLQYDWPEKNIRMYSLNRSSNWQCRALEAGESLASKIHVTEIGYMVSETFQLEDCAYYCVPWPGFKDK